MLDTQECHITYVREHFQIDCTELPVVIVRNGIPSYEQESCRGCSGGKGVVDIIICVVQSTWSVINTKLVMSGECF